MGVDAKLFVTCGKDKMYEVGQKVINAINIWQRSELDKHIEEDGRYMNRMHFLCNKKEHQQEWSNGCSIYAHNFDCISFDFKCGESRSLKMFVDCSCDYSDTYDGDKITFSLGCWGRSDEIMKVVAEAVAEFGDVYYDNNDCDDEDFVKLY